MSLDIHSGCRAEIDRLNAEVARLREASDRVCQKLEHETAPVNALDMWKLRDALSTTSDAWLIAYRAQVLEEAAVRCDSFQSVGMDKTTAWLIPEVSSAIRALKGKQA